MNAFAGMLADGRTFWLPERASTFAGNIDFIFYFIYWVSLIFFGVTIAAMIYFCIRYRRRHEDEHTGTITHNTPLELAWSIGPGLLLVPMFWWGFEAFMDSRIPPNGTYDITVVARRWTWEFIYPNGLSHGELHVPKDRPVKLIMRSEDVLHSLFVPAFRAKRDVVPGRLATMWFTATKAGEYRLYCAEYCGTSHSDMTTRCVVHPTQADFDSWLEKADLLAGIPKEKQADYLKDPEKFLADPNFADLVKRGLKPPVEQGKELFKKKGCAQCHAVDAASKLATCPPLFEKFGTTERFVDGGSVTIDEEYLRESMVEPGKRIVAGFGNNMPKILLKDLEIDCLIAYIKSLKSK